MWLQISKQDWTLFQKVLEKLKNYHLLKYLLYDVAKTKMAAEKVKDMKIKFF